MSADYASITEMVADLLKGTLEDAFSDYTPRLRVGDRGEQQYCVRWFDREQGEFHMFGRGQDGRSGSWDEPLGTFKVTVKVEKVPSPSSAPTWRDVAVAHTAFVQWVVQTHGPLPEGPVNEEHYNALKREWEDLT